MTDASEVAVREFRQILIWPLQLMPLQAGCGLLNHWDFLDRDPNRTWVELDDEFPESPEDFQERHYREFAAFLPHVQRFLYGERASRTGRTTYGESPIRIFRRADVKKARLHFHGQAEATEVEVVHTDLYFFFDVDVAILVVEIAARDLPLSRAQDIIYRFGRAYPAGWSESGAGVNCPERVEWLGADGAVLAASDYEGAKRLHAHLVAPLGQREG